MFGLFYLPVVLSFKLVSVEHILNLFFHFAYFRKVVFTFSFSSPAREFNFLRIEVIVFYFFVNVTDVYF